MALAVTVENSILGAILRRVPFVIPDGAFVAVHSSDPGRTGAGEIAVARQLGSFAEAADGISRNDAPIVFTLMPSVTVTHFGIWDAAVDGGFLWGGILDTPQVVNAGGTFEFLTAQLALAIN